ncbi:MAG: acyltransferase [Clostridiales bacterium]|nr:acyltransferase [Clostridiales bacterium]
MFEISKYRKELMGIAAAWVFLRHFGRPIFEGIWILGKVEWYTYTTGFLGVEIFIFLSGMGLVYAIHKETLKQFYLKRFFRVYPTFWIWLTVSTLVRDDVLSFKEYLSRITFYANWKVDLLEYMWYVPAILMLYLWFPFYYSIFRKRKNSFGFTAVTLCIYFLLKGFFYYEVREDLFLLLDRIPIFLIGVFAGHMCVEKKDLLVEKWSFSKMQKILKYLCLGIVIAINYRLVGKEPGGWLHSIRNATNTLTALIVCLGSIKLFDKISLNKQIDFIRRGFVFLGTLSLEFYLTHELISFKIQSYDLFKLPWYRVNTILEVGSCFIISLIGAWALSVLVKVFMHFLTKLPKFHIL